MDSTKRFLSIFGISALMISLSVSLHADNVFTNTGFSNLLVSRSFFGDSGSYVSGRDISLFDTDPAPVYSYEYEEYGSWMLFGIASNLTDAFSRIMREGLDDIDEPDQSGVYSGLLNIIRIGLEFHSLYSFCRLYSGTDCYTGYRGHWLVDLELKEKGIKVGYSFVF